MKKRIPAFLLISVGFLNACYESLEPAEPIQIEFVNFSTSVNESVAKGDSIGTINASTNLGELTFQIESQTVSNAIGVNEKTGLLTVNDPKAFNYVQNRSIGAWIIVSNGLISESVNVSLSIEPTSAKSLIQIRLNQGETPYGIYIKDTSLLKDLYGAKYQGGLIFYLNTTTGDGLVAAEQDQGVYRWGCEGRRIYSIGREIGDGWFNTYLINQECNAPNTAARVCADLTLNNYSDWFLPSRDELNLMHQNLHLNGHGNFSLNRYWSSTEYNANNAYCQFFNLNTNQLWYDKDLIPYAVRAVREF